MPNSYPCDGIFNLHLRTIKDSYSIEVEVHYNSLKVSGQMDPDQTVPEGAVQSGSTLVSIPSSSFGHHRMVEPHYSNFRIIKADNN